jgi:hypothetical protein
LSPLEREHRKLEAQRLQNDDTLQTVFNECRQDLLEELATATEDKEIRRLQAEIAAIGAIRDKLETYVLQAPREAKAVV